jgi:polysaccharide biosynthesis protein PslG
MPRSRKATRSLRACTAIVAIVAMGATAAGAQAVPGNFWGVIPQATPTLEQLQRLKRGGVDSIRVPVVWSGIQQAPNGPMDFSGVDREFEAATLAGLEVLPGLSGVPSWAVPQIFVPGTRQSIKAPRNLPAGGTAGGAWSVFVRAAVERYGPGGSFWTSHPALPQRPARTWQIWNEPNFEYFVAHPNPAEYAKLVKLSFAVARAVDPGAKIVLGGLFARPAEAQLRRKPPLAYFASDFIDRMYAAMPGIRSKFQGVALHPYTATYQRLTPYIEELRTVLKANHDAGKGLWITELGWSSQRPMAGNSFAKGMAGQKAQLEGAFRLLQAKQRQWRIKRVYWFSIDDQEHTCNFCNGSGLFSDGFVPKPAWPAYARFAGGRP